MPKISQFSFSTVAILASSIALSACSKNDQPAAEVANAAVTTPSDVQAMVAKTQCPELVGSYKDVVGVETTFTMATLEGGAISLEVMQRNGETQSKRLYMVDGAKHIDSLNPLLSYVATCADGVLKAVMTDANGKSKTETIAVEKVNDAGDITLLVSDDGVGTSVPMVKIAATNVAATPESNPTGVQDPSVIVEPRISSKSAQPTTDAELEIVTGILNSTSLDTLPAK